MTDLSHLVKDDILRREHAYRRPRDAATLVLVDRSGAKPKVLLGRRHSGHAFMAGKYVFPGGRVDPADRHAPFAAPLNPTVEAKLLLHVQRPTPAKARALALAAIRETCEEAGLLLGRQWDPAGPPQSRPPRGEWTKFAAAHVLPDLSQMAFVARAITPPGPARRYDTRFFTLDAGEIAHRIDGVVDHSTELVELLWVPIDETQALDLPGITRQVLRELDARVAAGFGHDLPVPFFRMQHGRLQREYL